jgi:hypothetical protein
LIEEVSAARAVGGPHVAQIAYADPAGDPPWLASVYVPGPTLAQLLLAAGPMSEPELRRLGAGLAGALVAIHAGGLVHRDLKPANIVLAEDGPRVVDFGIAYAVAATRLTYLGTAAGTAGFLAPEQVTGADVTPAADVFAFGAVLAAASGTEPFGDGGPLSVLYRTVHEEPDLGTLPESLRMLVAACLAKSPSVRPGPSQLVDFFAGSPVSDAVPIPSMAAGGAGYGPVSAPTAPTAPMASGMPVTPIAFTVPPAPVVPPQHPYSMPAPAVPAEKDQAFVGVDSHGGVSIDAGGVYFQRPGAELELTWDEIAQISYALSPRGNRFMVTVVLANGYQAHQEIDARRQSERLRLVGQLETALYLYAGGRHMAD